jgi:hypothetical protein
MYEQLKKLAELKDTGVLTEEEFAADKAKILNTLTPSHDRLPSTSQPEPHFKASTLDSLSSTEEITATGGKTPLHHFVVPIDGATTCYPAQNNGCKLVRTRLPCRG